MEVLAVLLAIPPCIIAIIDLRDLLLGACGSFSGSQLAPGRVHPLAVRRFHSLVAAR